MATVKFTLNKRGSDIAGHVCVLLTVNNRKRVRATVKALPPVLRDYWKRDGAHDCIDIRSNHLLTPWPADERAELNDKLHALGQAIRMEVERTDPEAVTRTWLQEFCAKHLNPGRIEGNTLLGAFARWHDYVQSHNGIPPRGGKAVRPKTVTNYRAAESVVRKFLKHTGRTDMNVCELTKAGFYDPFTAYCYEQGHRLNTVGQYMRTVKAAINALPADMRRDCELVDRASGCACKHEEVDNVALDETELQRLADLDLGGAPTLALTRDLFLLMAWSGCRWSDLPQLQPSRVTLSGSTRVIRVVQAKTGNKVLVPVLPPLQAILDKYPDGVPNCGHLQDFNPRIKDVCRRAGIDTREEKTTTRVPDRDTTEDAPRKAGKRGRPRKATTEAAAPAAWRPVTEVRKKWEMVSAHTARRSFATNMSRRGYSNNSIRMLTGHKTESAFLRYIKVKQEDNADHIAATFAANWHK